MKMFLLILMSFAADIVWFMPESNAQSADDAAYAKLATELANKIREEMEDYGDQENEYQTQNVYYRTQLAFDSLVDIEIQFDQHLDVQFFPEAANQKAKLVFSYLASKALLRSPTDTRNAFYKSVWNELFEVRKSAINRENRIITISIHSTKVRSQAVLWKLDYSPGMNSSVVLGFQAQKP